MNKDGKDEVVSEVDDPREAYESPRMESEELFEVVALSCGKIAGRFRQLNCTRVPRVS